MTPDLHDYFGNVDPVPQNVHPSTT